MSFNAVNDETASFLFLPELNEFYLFFEVMISLNIFIFMLLLQNNQLRISSLSKKIQI